MDAVGADVVQDLPAAERLRVECEAGEGTGNETMTQSGNEGTTWDAEQWPAAHRRLTFFLARPTTGWAWQKPFPSEGF